MKKLAFLLTLFTLLMVGCRPAVEEPQPAQPAQPVETFDFSLLYTDNDPFWGPQQDYFNGQFNDIKFPNGLSIFNAFLSVWGYAMFGADKIVNHDSRVGDLNKQLKEQAKRIREQSDATKEMIKALSDYMTKSIQLLISRIDISKQLAIAHNTIDRLNDLTYYINAANEQRDAFFEMNDQYYNALMAINARYPDMTQNDPQCRAYYKEVYQLLSEWAQSDYSAVVQAVYYPKFLASQNGMGMPAIYKDFCRGCCAWSNEAIQMQTYFNLSDLVAAIQGGQLTYVFLAACSYLNIGPDPIVGNTWKQQLMDNYLQYYDLYKTGGGVDSIAQVKLDPYPECLIQGAHFKADSTASLIPYSSHLSTLKKWDVPSLVYGALPNQVKQSELIPDSLVQKVMDFYQLSNQSLAQILVNNGMKLPTGVDAATCVVLLDGKCEDRTDASSPDQHNVFCSAAFTPLYYEGRGATYWLGTAQQQNNKYNWLTLDQNDWLCVKRIK